MWLLSVWIIVFDHVIALFIVIVVIVGVIVSVVGVSIVGVVIRNAEAVDFSAASAKMKLLY